MKKIIVIILSFLSSAAVYALNHQITPLGEWKTIDDVTGQPKAIVRITQASDGFLSGQILKIFPSPGHDEHELCAACNGDKHNQPIEGMVILEGLKQDQKNANEWINGHILDPKTGKVYRSMIQLMENGSSLKVRGYIGLPLFGRTQTWTKVNS